MIQNKPIKTCTSFRVNHLPKTDGFRMEKRPLSQSKVNKTIDQTQLTKKFFMNDIKKAIRKNDVSVLLGNKNQKLRTQPTAGQDSFYETAHDMLIEVRKKYDDTKKQRMCQISKTKRLKQRVKTLSKQHRQIEEKVNSLKQKRHSQKISTQQQQQIIQQTIFRLDILKSMKNRLKSDINLYKQKFIVRKNQYNLLNSQIITLKKNRKQVQNDLSKQNILLKQLKKQIQQQQYQRQKHLQNMSRAVDQRLISEQNKQTWKQFKNTTAIEALQSRDNQQKQWQNLILAHLFVKQFLNNKITIQMNKFEIIQKTFMQIKSKTEVNDSQSLVYRFLNRDLIYGELLQKVTQCKLKLQQLKKQKKFLIDQNDKINSIKQEIQNRQYLFYGKNSSDDEISPQMLKWNKKSSIIKERQYKIGEWLTRIILKIKQANKIPAYQSDYQIPNKSDTIKNKFIKYLQILAKMQNGQSLQDTEQSYHTKIVNPFMYPSLSEQNKLNNISMVESQKIKKSVPAQMALSNKSKDKNQIQEQHFYITAQRQNIINSNERYMKNIRAKYADTRRAKIQKDLKK